MKTITRLRRRVVLAAVVVFVLYLLLAFGLYAGLTSRVLGGNDFFSRWEGARALFLRGENPYSDAVTHAIQIGMNGRLALPGEDQVAFAYPLYVALPIAPFITLPYALAQACWMALLIVAVFSGTTALLRLYRLNVRPFVLLLLAASALVFYPTVRGIFNGQITLLSFFLISMALWAVRTRADLAAGILLAFATIKPQPVILLVPLVIIWAWRQHRVALVASTLGALGMLVSIATILVPTWLVDFLQSIGQYAQYEPVGPPIQILGEIFFPGPGSLVFTIVGSLVLLAWLTWRAARSLDKSWDDFQLAIGLAAVVSTLMAGRMGTPDQVLLLIPWSLWLSARLRHGENGSVIIAGLALLILPWSAFLATLHGNAEDPNVALVLPFLSLVVYLWETRRAERLLPEQAQ